MEVKTKKLISLISNVDIAYIAAELKSPEARYSYTNWIFPGGCETSAVSI